MPWVQIYNPFHSLALSALVAGVPIYILFYMLAIKRTPGHHAAGGACLASALLAIVAWRMPVSMAISSLIYGVTFTFFAIVWIIITAIWLYNMSVESGEFGIIKNSLACITDDRRLQAIFIAFAFGSFIEGTAGAGTPVAITTAMLVGLGFNPIYAMGVCLIADTAPVAFGAIGVPVIVASQVTGIDIMAISKIIGRQLPFLSFIVPFWLCVFMSGWKKSMEVLPAILVAGISFALPQFLLSNFQGPYLPDIVSSLLTILALGLFLRFWKPKKPWRFPEEPQVVAPTTCQYPAAQVMRAWTPYVILAVTIIVWGLDPVKNFLGHYDYAFNMPALHNLVIKTAPIVTKNTAYGAPVRFNYVTGAGTAIFLTGLLSVFVMPSYGFGRAFRCLGKTLKQLVKPILTVFLILGLAFVMNYSGMSSTLGIAFSATGMLFPFFSPIIGWLGVFLTGSDSSSNALFCTLQKTTAGQLGINPALTVAANSAGGVTAKMISPQSLSVGTAAAGLIGQEGKAFRMTVLHSVAMCLFLAALTFLQAYVLRWMLP